MVRTRRGFNRLVLPVLLMLCLAAGWPARLNAQCTLSSFSSSSPPLSFEPNPPGKNRPPGLASGKQTDLQIYQSGGNPRMLMIEAFGYSVLDLSNPASPTALLYDNLIFDPEPIRCGGDGQSYVASLGISADGARAGLSLNGCASPPYNTVVGSASGEGFTLAGDYAPGGQSGLVIQKSQSRYIAYTIRPDSMSAADVTTLPASLQPTNMTSENVSGGAGYNLQLAGNYLVFGSSGIVQILDASNPGPIGSITAAYPRFQISSADLGGRNPATASFSAAVDPSDSTKLWVLIELSGAPGPGYALVSLKNGVKTVSGQPFQIPALGGETWGQAGVSALVASGNNLFALMWATRTSPAFVYRLFSTSVAAWGVVTPGQFDVDPAVSPKGAPVGFYSRFVLRTTMRGLAGAGSALYAYVPTGNSAYVLPLSCVSSNGPAIASMAVANAGTSLSDGATVFLGDTITITPAVNPSVAGQPLTGFGWNFDFDFHVGAAYDDGGVGTSPRLKAPDNAAFGSGNQPHPPALITVVGPCDPQVGGTTPDSGAGCWASVTGNAVFAGGAADFTGAEPAGATKPLKFAFEANNSLGSAGASTFTLNWKVPAIRLKSAQILSGGAVDATGSDGHPAGSGYSWYFGLNQAAPTGETLTIDTGCTGSTCPHLFPGTGTRNFNVFVKVPYANGYVSPDCPGLPTACQPTTPLTVQVVDFLPSFLVSGQSAPVVTVVPGTNFDVTNQSQAGAAVTGITYTYSLCTDMSVGACTPSSLSLSFAGGLASVLSPSTPTGSWYLRIHVNYTGGGAGLDWLPSIAGVSDPKAFPLNVSSCANPDFHISFPVDGGGQSPDQSTGFSVQAGQLVKFIPNKAYATWSWNFGDGSAIDTTQSPTHKYSGAGNYTVTFTANGSCTVSYPMAVTGGVAVIPLSVSASANPSQTITGTIVNFSCSASGGTPGYTYTWGGAVTGTTAQVAQSFSTASTYSATCTVRDSASNVKTETVNVVVTGGSSGCSTADFHIIVDGGAQFPDSSTGFSVAAGHAVTFLPNGAYNTWSWSFGDGQTDATQSPKHTYTSPGTYAVSLTANGNCTRSYQIVVTGMGTSTPGQNCNTVDFLIKDTVSGISLAYQNGFGFSATTGEALTFTPIGSTTVTSWDFGDGSTSTANPGTYNYAGGGTYTVTLTAGTCTKTKDISISGPVALTGAFTPKYVDNSAFQATQVASGKAMSFLARDTADTYTWDFGDGSLPATGQTPTHTYVTPGSTTFTYTATLNVTKGTLPPASTTQSFTILPPPEPPKWFVAGMAYLQGGSLAGTVWQTDVTVFNPDPSRPATYSLAFLDHIGQDPFNPANLDWKKITLGAQQSISWPNILAFFGQPLGSFGAVLVRGDSAPVPPVLTARTFNIGDPTKGTFGSSVPSTQPSSGLTSQAALAQQFLIGLRDDDTAYTNIGLMNLTTDWSHARLTFLDRSGATNLGQVNVDVPPYGVAQLTRPLAAAPPNGVGFPDPLDTFSVRVTVLSGGAVFPYATVIDRRSTDSIVVTVSDRPSSTYRMPGIIRLQGANNTVWRSRFYITNPSTTSRKASISYSFVPCDATGCKSRITGLQSDVTLLPGETFWADDFPKVWLKVFGFDVSETTAYQASYVDVSPAAGDPNQEPLLVLGETYNDQPTGPVGLQVPGFTDADAASKTGAYKRLLLSGLVSNASYRTNVAMFLQSGTSGRCTVRVLSETGAELAHQDIGFGGATTFVQLDDNDSGLFRSIPGNKDRVTVVIDSFDGSPISAYATIVDNTSGDATFLKAKPAP